VPVADELGDLFRSLVFPGEDTPSEHVRRCRVRDQLVQIVELARLKCLVECAQALMNVFSFQVVLSDTAGYQVRDWVTGQSAPRYCHDEHDGLMLNFSGNEAPFILQAVSSVS
jgi:hypothetical protein